MLRQSDCGRSSSAMRSPPTRRWQVLIRPHAGRLDDHALASEDSQHCVLVGGLMLPAGTSRECKIGRWQDGPVSTADDDSGTDQV